MLAVFTTVLWVTCLTVGLAGFRMRYARPEAPKKPADPVVAQIVHVQLTSDALPQPAAGTASEPPSLPDSEAPPASPATPVAAPAAPALAPVATPSPAIAFAQPVEGPSRVVEAAQAVPRATAPATNTAEASALQSSAPATPAVRHITYGMGEGRQPAPEYPREAVVDREQGTVVVRFSVDAAGRVTAAQAAAPCPYPLLNQAAVRAVRESWRFAPGAARSYEVSIQFELRQR